MDISELFNDVQDDLKLRIAAGSKGLKREITDKHLHRPGLVLAGFTEGFPAFRIQLLGDSEILYLKTLTSAQKTEALTRLLETDIPALIVASNFRLLSEFKPVAENFDIPIFSTKTASHDVLSYLANYLDDKFAPTENIHGTLVDVYGTGLLLIGRASIGKSEIAIDLVERGHRLVADDVVILKRKASGVLIGSGPEMLKHLIEIRGVGVLNVRQMFGVRAIRLQKRVETVVELLDWNDEEDYERLGLDEQYREYLGVNIPLIELPIFPGKNITVIAEAIALNQHLKVYGFNAAKDLNEKLLSNLEAKRRIADYLRWDDE